MKAYIHDLTMHPVEDALAGVEVRSAETDETLFTISAEEGAGDYRGWPANVFALPLLEGFDEYPASDPAGVGSDPTLREWVEGVYSLDEGEHAFGANRPFLLERDEEGGRADEAYGWRFVRWIEPDEGYE